MTASLEFGASTDPRLQKPGVGSSSPGLIIDQEPAEDHHSRPGFSASMLKVADESLLEFYLRFERGTAPPKSSSSLEYGTLLHLWAEIGEEEFWKRAVSPPESCLTATGQMGTKAKQWLSEQPPEAICISPADSRQLREQTTQILRNGAAARLLEDSVLREFNGQWDWHGHKMRCRVDGATRSLWYDLKTTRLKDPTRSYSAFRDFRYHIQDAVYRSARRASGIWPDLPMRFIVTSTVFPYHCHVAWLPTAWTDAAERRCLRLMAEIKARREWDSWDPPTYGEEGELFVPDWVLREAIDG